jgi:hypothetical protein
MNTTQQNIFKWPLMPLLPPPGEVVLVRVSVSRMRKAARQELRAVLREILYSWSGVEPEELPLRETPRGPQWDGNLAGEPLDISLSYADDEGWIGLVRGASIGIDVMSPTPMEEMEQVTKIYLGSDSWKKIRESSEPSVAFAKEWTSLEARLKCLRRELTEWTVGHTKVAEEVPELETFFSEGVVVTTAVLPIRVFIRVDPWLKTALPTHNTEGFNLLPPATHFAAANFGRRDLRTLGWTLGTEGPSACLK